MRRLVLAIIVVACTPRAPPPAPDASPMVVASVVPEAAPAPPPVLAGAAQVELRDADGGATPLGVVSVPVGTHTARPIMIALHGGSDHPEWACNAWSGIVSSYAFVVCPRGVGATAALAWSTPADTRTRLERAVAATLALYGPWVRPTATTVLVGFSMGATQTAYLAQMDPKRYRRVALAESAYAPEPAIAFARPWAIGGGERALFLCTTDGCEGTYRNVARNLAAQHVPARLNIAGTHAHGMWEQVVQSMRRDWPWLVEGAEGWEDYVAPSGEPPGRSESFGPMR